MFGQVSVDVSGSDVDVKVLVKPYATVSGTVQLKNPKPTRRIRYSFRFCWMLPVSASPRSCVATAVLLFSPAAQPGDYRITIQAADRYFASGVQSMEPPMPVVSSNCSKART